MFILVSFFNISKLNKMVSFFIISFLLNAAVCDICLRPEFGENDTSPTSDQLVIFKEDRKGPVGYLTSSTGRRLEKDAANEVINEKLIFNDRFIEGLASLVREPTLPRVVHAKGGGATGYFVVTEDVSDIINVKMFNVIGNKTPLVARFSPTVPDFGGADTIRDSRGLAIKFNTPEGIFDFVGLSIPVFPIKDPIKFPSLTHAAKRNPQTHTLDENMNWDFITLNPESINFVLHLNSDNGIPCSYTKMPSYPIHTFAFCNSKGDRFFGRFRLEPDAGEDGLTSEEAERLAGKDPDYLNRELYDKIANGETPSWTLNIQALSEEEAEKADFDIWDVTLDLDESIYVPKPIGKVYLNENPENYIRDVESLAFCPRNLIPGLQGADKVFEARSLVYLDALNRRLGVNHNKIPINAPVAETNTYYRDGVPPLDSNGDNQPNYFPNSFFGPVPVATPQCQRFSSKIVTDPKPTNFEQAAKYFNGLPKDEQDRLVENIVNSLLRTTAEFLPERAIKLFKEVDDGLGSRIEAGLEKRQSELKEPRKKQILKLKEEEDLKEEDVGSQSKEEE